MRWRGHALIADGEERQWQLSGNLRQLRLDGSLELWRRSVALWHGGLVGHGGPRWSRWLGGVSSLCR